MAHNVLVLLSGGLDSSTVLALAISAGHRVRALSFQYGQRHSYELECACWQAKSLGVQHTILDLPAIPGSLLTDGNGVDGAGVPPTYVPARNTVFLAHALGIAEVWGADVWIGVNALDYSGYPDCRPEYIAAFQAMADLATRSGIQGRGPQIVAPLLHLTKAQIIAEGIRLGVCYERTSSCYNPSPDGTACGVCDACRIRAAGFAEVAK